MKMRGWMVGMAAGCIGIAGGLAQAGEREQARVYTYRVDVDAHGKLAAAVPLHDEGDDTSRGLVHQLRGWVFESEAAGAASAASTYVRVTAMPASGAAAPRILHASTGPAPDRLSRPEFPAAAMREGRQGVVVLRLSIDASGRVATVEVHDTEGDVNRAMAEAALATARGWTFHPERVDGVPVAGRMLMPVCFVAASAEGDCGWTGPGARAYDRDAVVALEPRVRLASPAR